MACNPRGVLFFCSAAPDHRSRWKTVEKHTRVTSAHTHLVGCGLVQQCITRNAPSVTDEELLTVHTQRHIDEVQAIARSVSADPENRGLAEPDGPGGVYFTAVSDAAARSACGCVVEAARLVLQPNAPRCALALVRPPGHHAGFDDTDGHRAEGFCFYNSVAVAAGSMLASGAAQRVAILDWDVHHGNGTQRLLYERADALYVSLHRLGPGWYPQTGHLDEVGAKAGRGCNVNVGWPADGLGDADYLAAFELVVLPILGAYEVRRGRLYTPEAQPYLSARRTTRRVPSFRVPCTRVLPSRMPPPTCHPPTCHPPTSCPHGIHPRHPPTASTSAMHPRYAPTACTHGMHPHHRSPTCC